MFHTFGIWGFGAYIQHPDGTCDKLFDACGKVCSNYEAEIVAIESGLKYVGSIFENLPFKIHNIVIFTDSKSALDSLENGICTDDVAGIKLIAHQLMITHNIRIIMQWIPGHSDIPGNDAADKLAKRGAKRIQQETPTSLQTVKQLINTKSKSIWLNRWATGDTGRAFYRYMSTPDRNDNINYLTRKDQSTIFRLRTQHIQLNAHLNRICRQHTQQCPLCSHPCETVDHHLFKCSALADIRNLLLPPIPNTQNTLYGDRQQLEKTCKFHYLALCRRADAQMQLDL
ncbi:hypothetical protein BsWGS_07173 [Bradybaena similaris]